MKRTNLTDSKIWLSFKNGEEWAINLIYNENAEKLYQYGLKFTNEIALIEDALQDLFTDLIKNRKTIGYTDNVFLFLLKSFKHKLFRKLKNEKKYITAIDIDVIQFDVVWSVEHEFISKETAVLKAKKLKNALEKLAPRQKEAIYLKFSKDLEYKDIAEIMNISVQACRNLISRSIIQLKKSLEVKKRKPLKLNLHHSNKTLAIIAVLLSILP